jgi:hypothetical protein
VAGLPIKLMWAKKITQIKWLVVGNNQSVNFDVLVMMIPDFWKWDILIWVPRTQHVLPEKFLNYLEVWSSGW